MNKELNYAELEEENEMLLMAHMERNDAKRSDTWFLDSSCSNHICANEGLFSSIDMTCFHTVKLGNNTSIKVTRKGGVKLTLNEVRYTISNVY